MACIHCSAPDGFPCGCVDHNIPHYSNYDNNYSSGRYNEDKQMKVVSLFDTHGDKKQDKSSITKKRNIPNAPPMKINKQIINNHHVTVNHHHHYHVNPGYFDHNNMIYRNINDFPQYPNQRQNNYDNQQYGYETRNNYNNWQQYNSNSDRVTEVDESGNAFYTKSPTGFCQCRNRDSNQAIYEYTGKKQCKKCNLRLVD